jgi:DNA-directed RNA polymerase specialized sigma24 family protein
MSESTVRVQVQALLDRLRRGDVDARNELINLTYDRLLALTRKIRKDFTSPARRTQESGSVLSAAYIRLQRALEQILPTIDGKFTPREFFGLASLQIRRELLDRIRAEGRGGVSGGPGIDPPTKGAGPVDLAIWKEFLEKIDSLPAEEREVVDLLFFQDLSQQEAAAVLGVDKSTVKRRWRRARETLAEFLGGELPAM